MPDALFQNFSTVQSKLQPTPVTVAAAATLVPITFLTKVTGTTAVSTVTPPVTGQHVIALMFTATNPGAFGTLGNIDVTAVTTPVTNSGITLLIYDPITAKYFPK